MKQSAQFDRWRNMFAYKATIICACIVLIDVIFEPNPTLPGGFDGFFEGLDEYWHYFLLFGVGFDFLLFEIGRSGSEEIADCVPAVLREPMLRSIEQNHPLAIISVLIGPILELVFFFWEFVTFKDIRR